MMATIQRLIDQLNEVEDKEQPLVFQYYLKEHFDYLLEDQDQTVADKAWDLACERTMSDDDWYTWTLSQATSWTQSSRQLNEDTDFIRR